MQVKIMRGIPGSGKSTLAREHQKLWGGIIFSTDDFWIDPNTKEYKFDVTRHSEAHAWCFREFLRALIHNDRMNMRSGGTDVYPYLIVDNTNITAAEIAPYILAASAHNIEHEIVTVWCDPLVAAARTTHGVSPKTMLMMYGKLLKEELPAWWNHRVQPAYTQPRLSSGIDMKW